MDSPSIIEQLNDACRRIVVGRKTARELAELVSGEGLKEVEFRLLWGLCVEGSQLDQTQLAELLSCSSAQVSTLVERLNREGLIVGQPDAGNRRRRLWQITNQGRGRLEKIVDLARSQSQPSQLRVHSPWRNSA